jgi:lysophospholipase L1-like esterase
MLRVLGKALLAIIALLVAVELALQAASLWGQWYYQREDALLRPDATRILCLGDSNTYGLYLPRESSWPSQLQDLLDREVPHRYQVINLGFPGAPTFRIADNLPTFLARFHPDLVIVLAGVNDFLYGAIDAANPRPPWRVRVRDFASTHIRLYRAWQLWQRSRQAPDLVRNDMDTLNAGLLSLHTLDDAQAVRTLASLYRERGFSIRESDGDFWLENGDRSVHLNEALEGFRSQDLYSLTYAYLRVPMQAGVDMRDIKMPEWLHINGDQFELAPRRGSANGNEEILARNLASIRSIVSQAHAEFLLLTYASHKHFYGQVNLTLRKFAADYNVPLLDIEPAISAQCADEACTALFFPDYHPNAEGYRLMAMLIARHIQAMEKTAKPGRSKAP